MSIRAVCLALCLTWSAAEAAQPAVAEDGAAAKTLRINPVRIEADRNAAPAPSTTGTPAATESDPAETAETTGDQLAGKTGEETPKQTDPGSDGDNPSSEAAGNVGNNAETTTTRKVTAATSADVAAVASSVQELAGQMKLMTSQIGSLQKQLTAVQTNSDDISKMQEQMKSLQSELAKLEQDHAAVLDRIGKLSSAVDNANAGGTQQLLGTLNTDEKERQKLQELMYVKSAVRFYNWEDRDVRINVNGSWRTLDPGENLVWVPYGPVAIHRWTNAEPQTFADWKPYADGFVMEFDVGIPPKKTEKKQPE